LFVASQAFQPFTTFLRLTKGSFTFIRELCSKKLFAKQVIILE